MTLPYIPPNSPGDPPAEELVVLFLEAVVRVVPKAFEQLRDDIFPLECWTEWPGPGVKAWLRRWHLNFNNDELYEMLFGQTIQVLRYWAAHPDARAALAVDAGLWEHLKSPKRRLGSDKKPSVLLPRWNPDRESHATWANRARADFDGYIRDEKQRAEAEQEKYNAVPYEPENLVAFDWLALHICCELSPKGIAGLSPNKRLTPATVKKALQRLSQRLKMQIVE